MAAVVIDHVQIEHARSALRLQLAKGSAPVRFVRENDERRRAFW